MFSNSLFLGTAQMNIFSLIPVLWVLVLRIMLAVKVVSLILNMRHL